MSKNISFQEKLPRRYEELSSAPVRHAERKKRKKIMKSQCRTLLFKLELYRIKK